MVTAGNVHEINLREKVKCLASLACRVGFFVLAFCRSVCWAFSSHSPVQVIIASLTDLLSRGKTVDLLAALIPFDQLI